MKKLAVSADTPLIRQMAGWSAKADHRSVAQKGEFSHRYSGRLKSPSLGASRRVSACADTIGAGKVGEGRPSACGPKR